MIRALKTAATGMLAQQLNVDNIANNLANINTTGYKRSKVEFQDLFYQATKAAGGVSQQGNQNPTALEIGYGSVPVATQRIFSQGEIVPTNNQLDLALSGDGFFKVLQADGTDAYTRDGSFKISGDGRIVTTDGDPIDPEITIPEGTTEITVSRNGAVSVKVGKDANPQEVGQIETVRFINPAGLKAIGRNLLLSTVASGDPVAGTPGLEGNGEVYQGYLESSNVEIVEEMVNMIVAQRAYEINSKAIKTSDEMLAVVNNLGR
ncbi:MAG TPA: flagellar basal-body rod protein FlgG [bacterium]|nr:flagellar basal-body rod protein FlgG [bacterium]